MGSKNQGFNLIELMIATFILAIIVAIAVPIYQIYTGRSHVAEGISLMEKPKAAITEHFCCEGSWPTSNAQAGLSAPESFRGYAVDRIAVEESGVIMIYYNAKVKNQTLGFRPLAVSGAITWSCLDGDMQDIYRPAECRR